MLEIRIRTYIMRFVGCVAQLVEQLTLNQWVHSSNLCASTNFHRAKRGLEIECRP